MSNAVHRLGGSGNPDRSNIMTITTRSKIAIRYTTNPANMGYGGVATDWRNAAPDTITSPARALEYLRDLRSRMGGTFYAVDLQCKGVPVTREDLDEVVAFAEFQRRR